MKEPPPCRVWRTVEETMLAYIRNQAREDERLEHPAN